MQYLGDYAEDYATLNFKFSTHKADGTPATLSGTPAISVYKANGTTQSTAGITLSVDFDSVTGLNNVLIDLSADAFYAVASDYQVVITTGTVDSVSVVGTVLAHFSIENRFNEVNVTAISGDSAAADNLESACDNYSATRGLAGTALPNAAADAAGGLPISDAGALDLDAKLAHTEEITAARMGALTDWIDGGRLDLLIDGIKAKTDQLTFTTPNSVDATATVSIAGLATEENQTTIINHLTDVKGATFSGATDSLEAIRNRGDVAWITGGTGGGSNAVTINVKDDNAANVVDCYVEIWDIAGTSFISRTNTNSSGNVTFNLDSNNYIVKMHKTGYYFTDQTLVVDGVESESYTGTILTPDAPTSPTLCRIYGYYFDPAGSTYSAVKSLIKLTAIYEAADNNYYTSELIGTYNTTTGLLYFDVIQRASVTLEIPILNVKKSFVVPATTLYKISDIA